MSIEIEKFCPLDKKCEELADGKIKRCRWFIMLKGEDPQTKKEYDEWGCSWEWVPILLVEGSRTNRGQTHALESFRNEVVKGQKEFNAILKTGITNSKTKKLLDEE